MVLDSELSRIVVGFSAAKRLFLGYSVPAVWLCISQRLHPEDFGGQPVCGVRFGIVTLAVHLHENRLSITETTIILSMRYSSWITLHSTTLL